MILERSMEPGWLSNSYVVGDRPGGSAVLIDAGGPPAPIVAAIDRHRLNVTHILVTHHHGDHVEHLAAMRERYGAPVLAHALEAPRLAGGADALLADGDVVETGGLRIDAIHTPGHTDGMLAFVVNGSECFTGDTLFAGSVGGVRGATATSFEDLRSSGHGPPAEARPRVRRQPRAHRPLDGRARVGDEPVRPALARARQRGHRSPARRSASRRR